MSDEGEGRTRPTHAADGVRARATATAARRPPPGWLLPAAGCAVALVVRLRRLDESCLWFDELFGLHAARHAWIDLPRFVALDLVHPPLFYLLLKLWAALGGESVWWLRLLPALLSSLALVPLALLARELKLPARVAALALALAAASGFLIKYAQEVRMYAPLLLFSSCSLWLLARLCRGRDEAGGGDAADSERDRRARPAALAALTAANLLLVYTHYFGWLLVALELAFVAFWARGRLRPLALSVLLIAVCFAPWAWTVWRAAGAVAGGLQQNIGWAARPGALEPFLPYVLLHEPFRFQRHSAESVVLRLTVLMSLLVFAPALAALAARRLKRSLVARDLRHAISGGEAEHALARRESDRAFDATAERGDAQWREGFATPGEGFASSGGGVARRIESFALRFLVFFSAAPVAAAFVLSWVLPQSVWGTRHLAVVAPAYLLLAAHAVTSLRPRWLSAGAQLLLACWLLLALAGWLARRPAPLVWCSWDTLAARLAQTQDGGGRALTVYATEELAAYHLWHALRGRGDGAKFRVVAVKNFPGVVEDRAFFLPRGFDEISVQDADAALRSGDFWIAFRAPAADEGHPLLHALAARGYEIGQRFEATAQGQRVTLARATRR